jgi:MFS family permease
MGFAAAVGPSLGGLLVHHFGWGAIFLMNLPPLLLSVYFSMGFFKRALHEKPPAAFRFDWLGTVLMALALVCLVTGLKNQSALLLPALLLLAVFVWWQAKAPQPLIDLRLFSDRSFSAACAITALQNLSMYALLFQLPYLLKLLYQWGPEQSGHYMTTFMVSMMAASMLGGRVAEAIGVRTTCVTGALISFTGLTWLSMLTPEKPPMHIIGALVLGGTGLGLVNGPSQSAAMAGVDPAMSGIASGVISTFRYLGGVIGISILALLLSAPASAQSLDQYHQAILVFAGSFFLAAMVALLLPQHPKHV